MNRAGNLPARWPLALAVISVACDLARLAEQIEIDCSAGEARQLKQMARALRRFAGQMTATKKPPGQKARAASGAKIKKRRAVR